MLNQSSIRRLIRALNQLQSEIDATGDPDDTTWNFAYCDRCALAVAREIGLIKNLSFDELSQMTGIPTDPTMRIFASILPYGGHMSQVTPSQVARQLELLLIAEANQQEEPSSC